MINPLTGQTAERASGARMDAAQRRVATVSRRSICQGRALAAKTAAFQLPLTTTNPSTTTHRTPIKVTCLNFGRQQFSHRSHHGPSGGCGGVGGWTADFPASYPTAKSNMATKCFQPTHMGRDNLEIKHIAVLVPTFTKRPQLGGRRGAPFILLVIFIHTHTCRPTSTWALNRGQVLPC